MPDNGIVERLHRTLLDEHFRVEGRKTWFETIEAMQTVLDLYLIEYNSKRPARGPRHERQDAAQGIPRRHPQTQQKGGRPRTQVRRLTPAWAASVR